MKKFIIANMLKIQNSIKIELKLLFLFIEKNCLDLIGQIN